MRFTVEIRDYEPGTVGEPLDATGVEDAIRELLDKRADDGIVLVEMRRNVANNATTEPIPQARVGVASAARVDEHDGAIELLLTPRASENWPPRAYLMGPVTARSLYRLLGAALDEPSEP